MNNKDALSRGKNDFTKILLQYYRQLENHPGTNNLNFDFMLFGYFDCMKFKQVENIADYEESPAQIDTFQQNYEIQRLCIYNKDASSVSILEKDTLRPFIVITELKINEDVLNSISEKREEFFESCCERINEQVNQFTKNGEIQCKTFFSLGYSDIVVIFRSNEFQSVANLILKLRNLSYGSSACTKRKRALFKSSYSVSGVRVDSIQDIKSEKISNVSIRFSLRNNAGYEEIKKEVHKQLIENTNRPYAFIVFGKYDLEIKIDAIPLKTLINFFQSETYKKLDDEFLGHTNTHWLLDYSSIETEQITNNNEVDCDIHEVDVNWIHQKNLQDAFHKIIQTLYQLERNDASEKTLIDELSQVIVDFNAQAKEGYDRIKNENSVSLQEYYKQEHYENMRKGMELITKLINSNIQSFRFYTEVPSYDIQIVKSATKLYVLYKNVVEDIENIINTSETEKQINLFVVLGYFGNVNQTILFPQASEKLVAIELSIESFFRIPYNLLLLCHEISHSIPIPKDPKYFETIVSIFSYQIATLVTSKMIMGDEQLNPDLFNEKIEGIFVKMKDDLGSFIEERVKDNLYYKNTPKTQQNIDVVFLNSLDDEVYYYDENVKENWNCFSKLWNSIEKGISEDANKKTNRLEKLIIIIKESLIYGREIDSQINLFQYLLSEMKEENSWGEEDYQKLRNAWEDFVNSVAKVKSEKIVKWKNFVCQSWLPKIDELNNALPKLSLCDCSILNCLSDHYILEATPENAQAIVERILQYLFEKKPIINSSIKNDIKIMNEFTADYWMCKLLDLKWGIYNKLIEIYMNENEEWIEIDELKIRKRMIQMAKLFTSENDAGGNEKNFEDYDVMLDNIHFSSYTNYLNNDIEKDNPYKIFDSESINVLRMYFHELDSDDLIYPQSFSNLIQLIEYFTFKRKKPRGKRT